MTHMKMPAMHTQQKNTFDPTAFIPSSDPRQRLYGESYTRLRSQPSIVTKRPLMSFVDADLLLVKVRGASLNGMIGLCWMLPRIYESVSCFQSVLGIQTLNSTS